MIKEHKAVEQYSFEETLAKLPVAEEGAQRVLSIIGRIRPLPRGASVLDVGAAQGRFVIGCAKQGYRACGVEPWDEAREVGRRLAEHEGVEVELVKGFAEELPLDSEAFDVVHAMSVIEHVRDAQAAFNEAWRVLKSGGVFWFFTASSVCPKQSEIRGFPLFGWYPNSLKLRIMEWARINRPELVGFTQTPAINWFTPGKAHRMLRQAGFTRVYDQWDFPRSKSEALLKRLTFGFIRLGWPTKLVANMLREGCIYAAIK